MAKPERRDVVPSKSGKGWDVTKPGGKEPVSHHLTQTNAERSAKQDLRRGRAGRSPSTAGTGASATRTPSRRRATRTRRRTRSTEPGGRLRALTPGARRDLLRVLKLSSGNSSLNRRLRCHSGALRTPRLAKTSVDELRGAHPARPVRKLDVHRVVAVVEQRDPPVRAAFDLWAFGQLLEVKRLFVCREIYGRYIAGVVLPTSVPESPPAPEEPVFAAPRKLGGGGAGRQQSSGYQRGSSDALHSGWHRHDADCG